MALGVLLMLAGLTGVSCEDCHSPDGLLSARCMAELLLPAQAADLEFHLAFFDETVAGLAVRLEALGVVEVDESCKLVDTWNWALRLRTPGRNWTRRAEVGTCRGCGLGANLSAGLLLSKADLMEAALDSCASNAYCAFHECASLGLPAASAAGYLRAGSLGGARLCCWSDGVHACGTLDHFLRDERRWLAVVLGGAGMAVLGGWLVSLWRGLRLGSAAVSARRTVTRGREAFEREKGSRLSVDRLLAAWSLPLALGDEMGKAYSQQEAEVNRCGEVLHRDDMEKWNFFGWRTSYQPKRRFYRLLELTHWLSYEKIVSAGLGDFFKMREREPQYDTFLGLHSGFSTRGSTHNSESTAAPPPAPNSKPALSSSSSSTPAPAAPAAPASNVPLKSTSKAS